MSRLLEITGPSHRDMVKEAFIPLMSKLIGRAGKVITKHPLKSAGAGLIAMDSGTSLARMNKAMADASRGGHNLARSVPAFNM